MDDSSRPLAEYGALMATFATVFSVGTAAARRQGRLPPRVGAGDVVLGGMATQKVSRLVTKDRVTRPVRAPFTEVEAPGPNAEMEERPSGGGVRRAIGELLTCPFCLSQWIAAGFTLGLLYAPRVTRLVMAMNAMVAISDFLQIAYKGRREPPRAGLDGAFTAAPFGQSPGAWLEPRSSPPPRRRTSGTS